MDLVKSSKDADIFSGTTSGERLKIARNMAGATQNTLAQASGVSALTIGLWENGKHGGITQGGAFKVSQGFKNFNINCSVNWLLIGSGTPPERIEESQIESRLDHPQALEQFKEEIDHFLLLNPSSLSMMVQDTMMAPIYSLGDCVAGPIISNLKDIEKLCGKPCIIETVKYGTVLRIVSDISENTVTLVTTNFKVLGPIKWSKIAPVVWHRKPTPILGDS